MTRRLILLRHAKSSWDDLTLSDHERPLNARGRRAAQDIGFWFRQNEFVPDFALCSTATRTRETLERSELSPETSFLRPLYHASAEQMLETIRHNGQGGKLLVVAHNPGIGALAEQLLRQAPTHRKFGTYPTGAVLVCDFDIENWRDARFGIADFTAFIVPRDLPSKEPLHGETPV